MCRAVSTAPKTWSSILTFELRSDGFSFASAADGLSGSFVSAPITWNGGELSINADCLAAMSPSDLTTRQPGSVTIAVVEEGHRAPSSHPFAGNETNATVFWPGGGRMSSLAGKVVQLEVQLSGAAQLYALRGDFSWNAS